MADKSTAETAPADNGVQHTTPVGAGEKFAREWAEELKAAEQRESRWRKDADRIVGIYEGKHHEEIPFNILYSNTDTLSPALYNQIPRPQVKPRFKDQKVEAVKHAARVAQRMLEFFMDEGESEYPSFDALIKKAVLASLVPGRGLTQFAHHAETEEVAAAIEGAKPTERVAYETVCGRDVEYNSVLHGYGRTWKEVQWVAFGFPLTREELKENYPEDVVAKIVIAAPDNSVATDRDAQEKKDMFAPDEAVSTPGSTALVYVIWDKIRRKCIHISPNAVGVVLKEEDDPLELMGFYPCPQPLQLFAKLSSLISTPLYQLYRQQAIELNDVTVRIRKLVSALKVRGLYDSTIGKIDEALKADDNTLLPVQDAAVLTSQGRKLEDAIFLMPIDKLVAVLQQLYTQRQQIKSIIFEITGIADIMRGSTQASETLGAQEIKNQWGTLRLKRMQKEVARYCRDALRIMLEIGVTKLSIDTIAKMTGLEYLKEEGRMQLQQMLQQGQQMKMQLQQQGQEIPPEAAAKEQELQELIAQPSWEEIMKVLQSDTLRTFSIDIETNSTVDIEATEDKKDLGELLNAVSQFLNGTAPLIESGTMPFEVAQSMLITVLRRFRLGDDVEDQLKKMRPPQPKDDGKAKALEAKAAMDKEAHDADMKLRQQEMQWTMQEKQMDMQLKEREHAMKMQEMDRKAELDMMKHQAELEKIRAGVTAAVVQAETGAMAGQQKLDQQGQSFQQKQQHTQQMNKQQQAAAAQKAKQKPATASSKE